MRSGRLKAVITSYKYEGKTGWAWILGRILVGYLESNAHIFSRYDLIIPMPTFVGPGGRSWDHIATIIERAVIEGPLWPFRPQCDVQDQRQPYDGRPHLLAAREDG